MKSLVPGTDGRLPLMLLALTALTGVVDAVSILALGRVFVANMTGNVVFIGFAVAGAAGFSLVASLCGLGGFLVGAGAGGQLLGRFGRSRLLAVVVSIELALLVVATSVVGLSPASSDAARYGAILLLAVAMGMQNAVARHLAVPDLTTTVLTMTLTGLASDLNRTSVLRRLLAVGTMLGGAAVGAALVIDAGATAALSVGTALLALVVTTAWYVARDQQPLDA